MTNVSAPEIGSAAALSPETGALVTAFARACRAATRAIALYPAEHPTVSTTMVQLVSTANQASAAGELRLNVLPDTLAVDGRKLPKPDTAVTELASLLHAHQLAALSIQPHSTPDEWRRFLSLVALPPDQARRRGGLCRLWASEGQTRITTRQVDYSILLTERLHGERVTWDAIVADCLEGDAQVCDDGIVNLVMEILDRPDDVGRLLTALTERTTGTSGRTAFVIVGLLQALAEFVGSTQPDHMEPLLIAMAEAVSQLPTDALASVAAKRSRGSRRDKQAFIDGLARRMTDEVLAEHVVQAVSDGGGSSQALDAFLGGFVPDVDRRSSVVALARHMLEHGDTSRTSADLQARIAQLVASHDDRPFVSDAYANELRDAAARAVELDRDATDSAAVIAAWTHSVSDDAIRILDAHLLVDLMQLKREVGEWREMARLALARVSVLLVVGDFSAASFLVEAIRLQHEDHPNPDVRAAASLALGNLLNADLMRHVASHLDSADLSVFNGAKRFCHAVGPAVVPYLAEVLSREERARPRQHLIAILKGFGAAGRQSVERLMQSSNAAVRRTAIMLLREFGGHDALPKLQAMLHDEEPHVQREATRAIALLAIEPAYEALTRALTEGGAASRAAITSVLWSLPAEETEPLLSYIVTRAPLEGSMRAVHERALQRLGSATGTAVTDALGLALTRGSLLAPFRTRGLRRLAAGALARIGTPDALEQLRAAAASGVRGVRKAAAAALAGEAAVGGSKDGRT